MHTYRCFLCCLYILSCLRCDLPLEFLCWTQSTAWYRGGLTKDVITKLPALIIVVKGQIVDNRGLDR